ncbi:MAG: heavy metal-associated domain-containing protein [Niabella sp.]
MTHTYNIQGMTCKSCVAKVKSELLKLGDITEAEVQLAAPQATITMQKHIPLTALQAAIHKAGRYMIFEERTTMPPGTVPATDTESSNLLVAYKPVLLIAAYITLLSFITATTAGKTDWMLWMRVFMSGFFISFSFFKMLNLKGFADSYSMYDIIAKKFYVWGYIYSFIELALGMAYASDFNPLFTNTVAFIVMAISLIGVLQSVLNKKRIQCACLGTVFNLPMSTVTIIEDSAMIIMSAIMLASVY